MAPSPSPEKPAPRGGGSSRASPTAGPEPGRLARNPEAPGSTAASLQPRGGLARPCSLKARAPRPQGQRAGQDPPARPEFARLARPGKARPRAAAPSRAIPGPPPRPGMSWESAGGGAAPGAGQPREAGALGRDWADPSCGVPGGRPADGVAGRGGLGPSGPDPGRGVGALRPSGWAALGGPAKVLAAPGALSGGGRRASLEGRGRLGAAGSERGHFSGG